MQVFIQISPPPGSIIGPNFSITPNIGSSNIPIANLSQLTSGITITLSNASATSIVIKSLGTCGTSHTIFITPTTTTTSSSTTTSTTIDPGCPGCGGGFIPGCSCYKLTNTLAGVDFNFTYNKCDVGNISDTIKGAGQSGSVVYICSLNLPIFSVPLGSNSVIVEPILSSNSEIVNCDSPCYFNNFVVVGTPNCISSVKLIFDIFKSTLSGNSLNNLSGPTLLRSFISCPGQNINHCSIPGYSSLCDISCSPLFLGGKTVQELFVNSLTPQNNCYSSDLGNCCWVHASPPSDANSYCYTGGINYTNLLPATCYDCIPCPSGGPITSQCSQQFCIDNFGVKIYGNCETEVFPDTNPLSREFTSTLLDIKNELSVSQWQDLVNLHIIESGVELYTIPSLLTQVYNQLNGLSANLKYQYLKVILEEGLVITQGGWGGCNTIVNSVESYLCTNNLNCTTTTSTSTSTTTSSSTTTTTTCQCYSYNISVSQSDLDDSESLDEDGNTIPGALFASYKTCEGTFREEVFFTAGSYPSAFCSCCTPSLWFFNNGIDPTESTLSTSTQTTINCSLTTTTTAIPCQCISITGVGESCPTSEGTYTDCDGNTQSYFLPIGQTDIICAPVVPGSKFVLGGILDLVQTSGQISVDEEYGNNLLIEGLIDAFYTNCPCAGTTTTTTTIPPTTSTTTTTTCNCFVTSIIAVNTDCGDCEEKLPAAVKYTTCEGIQIMEQVPSGIITTLQNCVIIGSITPVTGTVIKGIQEKDSCCIADDSFEFLE